MSLTRQWLQVMWTQMHVPRSLRDFNPNHFVPIVPRINQTPVVIDLSIPFTSFGREMSNSSNFDISTTPKVEIASKTEMSSNAKITYETRASTADSPSQCTLSYDSALDLLVPDYQSANVFRFVSTEFDDSLPINEPESKNFLDSTSVDENATKIAKVADSLRENDISVLHADIFVDTAKSESILESSCISETEANNIM